MSEPAPGSGPAEDAARAWWSAAAAVFAVSLLPFLRGLWLGNSFYFRDLFISVLPLRRFVALGLRGLEVRDWVPWVYEGSPLHLPPLGYPPELLQALVPDEAGISLLIALHVPFAGLSMLYLTKRLGGGPLAGFGAGVIYALGGFALSTLNLYFYVHALAWAPLVVAVLPVAAERWRGVAPAALVLGAGLSTFGAELMLQAIIAGSLLALWPWRRGRLVRLVATGALGAALAAVPLSLGSDLTPGSARGAGFTADVVLGHSVHPIGLLQLVIGSFFGDLSDLTRHWWGHNFFPRGFPYILSLYLGALTLALAGVGLRHGRGPRWRLGLLGAAALLLCLGRWIGLTPLVESLPVRPLRYPVKAFFSVHLAVAVLSGLGLEALRRAGPRAWRSLAVSASSLGVVLVAASLAPRLAPAVWERFLGGFLPPAAPLPMTRLASATILLDAAAGGAVALAAAALAVLAARGRLPLRVASLGLVALLAADLLRTGAGLNPMISTDFFQLSPAMQAQLGDLREGRVFTCDPEASPAFRQQRARLEILGLPHELLTFAVARETLSHHTAVLDRVPTALGLDLTMWVPEWRVASPRLASCGDLESLVPRLRSAAVHRVLSLDPLSHPDLRPLRVIRPRRLEPLAILVYALEDPLPLVALAGDLESGAPPQPGADRRAPVPGRVRLAGPGPDAAGVTGRVDMRRPGSDRIEVDVRASAPSAVVVREAWAPGWSASLDGREAPVVLADARHLAVRVPAGSSSIVFEYAPPSRSRAATLAAAALVVVVLLAWSTRGRARPAAPSGAGKSTGVGSVT